MKKGVWLLLGALVVLVGTPAWAQYEGNEFTFSAFVGPNFLDTGNKFDDHNIDRAFQANYGASFEYLFAKYVGIEVWGGVTWGDVDVLGGEVGYNFHNIYLQGNLVIHLMPDATVVPYITGGGGLVNMVPQRGRSVTRAAWNAGVGLDYFASERWAARVEARLLGFSFDGAEFGDLTRSDLNIGPEVSFNEIDTVVSVGFRLRF